MFQDELFKFILWSIILHLFNGCNIKFIMYLSLFELAKLKDIGFILSLSAADVQRLTRLSANDVATLHTAAAEAVSYPAPVTGLDDGATFVYVQ